MLKERLKYFDIAKGLLIFCLCLCHFPHSLYYIDSKESTLMGGAFSWHYTFTIFFMQAFFFINGYCSNYNSQTKKFLWKTFKTYVIPALFFTIINRLVLASVYATTIHDFLNEICHGVGFWFLWSLFTCRIIYFFMHKLIRKDVLKAIFCLSMLVIAFFSHLNEFKDLFFHQMSFSLCIFIFLGQLCRKHQRIYEVFLSFGWLYIPLIIAITYFCIPYSIISGTMNVGSYKEIPVYLICAISGTFFCLWLSKYLTKIKLIEEAGKNSLNIYGFHFPILCLLNSLVFVSVSGGIFESSTIIKILYYFIFSFLTLLISLHLSKILLRFYIFRLLTGKIQ